MSYDPVGPRLLTLLACLDDSLTAAGVPACRTFVHPGADAPWDACGTTSGGAEGQAWVALQRLYPVDPFPVQDQGAQRCHPIEYAADVVVGVLRCAATVDDQGRPPPVAAVTADAMAQTRDAALILDGLLCCYAEDLDPGQFRLGNWAPLGPSGGCVGGQWSVTIAIPTCPCEEV